MANNDKAFGLRPLGNLAGTGGQKQYGYEIADNQAGAIFQGDLSYFERRLHSSI